MRLEAKSNTSSGALSLPAAIIVAGAMIAVALIWINKPARTDQAASTTDQSKTAADTKSAATTIAKVTNTDHILGNPNAPIKLIEYSDLSCPFCKIFNPTMDQIMKAYGPSGRVAWVYRQLPLYRPIDGDIPHPNSLTQAEALECIAQLGGNTAFFSFEKKWFESFPETGANRNSAADRKEIDRIAKEVSKESAPAPDMTSFGQCLADGRFKTKIAKSYDEGLAAGINGTPFTAVLTPSGNMIALEGIQTYTVMKNMIDTLITTINTATTTQQY